MIDPSPCCDWWPHAANESCLFDACDICGGMFSLGPSTSRTCYVCAFGAATLQADALKEIDDREERRRDPQPAWDERPF